MEPKPFFSSGQKKAIITLKQGYKINLPAPFEVEASDVAASGEK